MTQERAARAAAGGLVLVGVCAWALLGAVYVSASTFGGGTSTARDGEDSAPTILIVGVRGYGSESNMVFVDGITTGLVGQQVTPYFRFPGQTGFTSGTGTRTVDANGDFAWGRKAGKQITIEFRSGEVRSNQVNIAAR